MTYSHRAACLMQNHFTHMFCGVARQGCRNWLAWSPEAGIDTVTKPLGESRLAGQVSHNLAFCNDFSEFIIEHFA